MLSHPRAAEFAAACPGGVLAARLKDGEDLAARVLPLLAGARPLDAWAGALAREEAQGHSRCVRPCVRAMGRVLSSCAVCCGDVIPAPVCCSMWVCSVASCCVRACAVRWCGGVAGAWQEHRPHSSCRPGLCNVALNLHSDATGSSQ